MAPEIQDGVRLIRSAQVDEARQRRQTSGVVGSASAAIAVAATGSSNA